jgi:hypothetical protein
VLTEEEEEEDDDEDDDEEEEEFCNSETQTEILLYICQFNIHTICFICVWVFWPM